MTIRMLQAWNGLHQQKIVTTLSGSDEAALVAAGIATYDLDGPAENLRMAQLATDAGGDVDGIFGPSADGVILSLAEKNRYYHFHGAASVQCADDPMFFDMSGTNNGTFGAHLSVANAWANPGYVSTVDPIGGSTDSVIRIPSLNYDYDGGEKLIVWWCGKATAEGSDVTFMGDSYGPAVPGVRVRARSTGKVDVVCCGGGVGRYSPASTAAVFDGAIRDFGFVIDGASRKYGVWVDGVFDAAMGGALGSMGAGSADTRTSNTWQIGAGSAAPGGTDGIAVRTRGMVIIRLPASRALPAVGDLTTIFKQLRANPSALILAGAL